MDTKKRGRPVTTIQLAKLIELANDAREREPADHGYAARCFFALLVGSLDRRQGNDLARAIGFGHLVTGDADE